MDVSEHGISARRGMDECGVRREAHIEVLGFGNADRHLVLFGDGDTVSGSAEAEPLRFLLISGKPIGEPVAWYGPIV
jgi:redox-sensitive bicupin YhaK (pirin superfamily)